MTSTEFFLIYTCACEIEIRPYSFSTFNVNNEQQLIYCVPQAILEKECVIIILMRGRREGDC